MSLRNDADAAEAASSDLIGREAVEDLISMGMRRPRTLAFSNSESTHIALSSTFVPGPGDRGLLLALYWGSL